MSDTKLIEYPIADATIDQLASRYMPLTIGGVDDTAGFANVKKARIEIKGLRCDVENKRKALKKDALDWGRAVDAEAKRITAKLTPIESHLQEQEQAITEEKNRVKREAELAARLAVQKRMEQLQAVGCVEYLPNVVEHMDEESFGRVLNAAQQAYKQRQKAEAERKRLAAEEEERLAAEREELAAARRGLEEAQAKVAAEKKRLADEAAAVEREAEMERQKKLAAERAVIEERQRAEREAAEAKAKAEREEAERKRQEALRPDQDKLLAVASIVAGIGVPVMTGGASADEAAQMVSQVIDEAAEDIRNIAEDM